MHRRTVGLLTLGVATVVLVAAVIVPAGADLTPTIIHIPATAPVPTAPVPTAPVPTAPAPTSPVASGEVLAALQRDLHLTPEQARARLAGEGRAALADAQLRAELGPRFAGSWVRGTKLTVAVTDAESARLVRATGAEVKIVNRGAAELDRTKAELDRVGYLAPDGVSGWYVDEVTNTVVVTARSTKQAKVFAATGGLRASDVRVVESAEAPRTLFDVRGGDPFQMGSGRCSVGFAVVGGFVTAGHCGRSGTTANGFDQTTMGSFAGSSFPANDYAFVRTNSNWTPQPFVNDHQGGNVVVAGNVEAPVGAAICRSGSATGWHCGTVQAKNVTVNYPQGQVGGLTQTDVCAEPGDSGGAWISGDQAQGVTSGGFGDCTLGGTTYFQPINEILSVFKLTLITQGGSTPPPPSPPVTPPVTPPATPPATPPVANEWKDCTEYQVGAQVTYEGVRYLARIPHRSKVGWEPPKAPALWIRL